MSSVEKTFLKTILMCLCNSSNSSNAQMYERCSYSFMATSVLVYSIKATFCHVHLIKWNASRSAVVCHSSSAQASSLVHLFSSLMKYLMPFGATMRMQA